MYRWDIQKLKHRFWSKWVSICIKYKKWRTHWDFFTSKFVIVDLKLVVTHFNWILTLRSCEYHSKCSQCSITSWQLNLDFSWANLSFFSHGISQIKFQPSLLKFFLVAVVTDMSLLFFIDSSHFSRSQNWIFKIALLFWKFNNYCNT